jgi:hypothetical protein
MQTAKIAIHREQFFIDLPAAAALVRVILASSVRAIRAHSPQN